MRECQPLPLRIIYADCRLFVQDAFYVQSRYTPQTPAPKEAAPPFERELYTCLTLDIHTFSVYTMGNCQWRDDMTIHTHPEIQSDILELSKSISSEIGASENRLRADIDKMKDELKSDIAGLQFDMRRVITWIESQGG